MDTVGGEKLQDFLRIKQDNTMNRNTGGGRNNLAGLTLTAVLSDRTLPSPGPEVSSPPRIQSFRTLLDIIQEDQAFNNAHMKDNKKSWKGFKSKLRFRRGGSGSSWISSMRMPTSEIPINRGNNTNALNSTSSRMFTRRASAGLPYIDPSTQPDFVAVSDMDRDLMSNPRSRASPSLQRNASSAAGRTSEDANSFLMPEATEDEGDEASRTEAEAGAVEVQGEGENEEEEEMGNEEDGGEQQPARMSLMALLAETDREIGLGGSPHSTEEEEEEENDSGATAVIEYNSCCVCMVRHKGAAFIPCGHTFCRLCCRELLVQRGSCPLCNNYIVEILDIF